MYQCFIRNDQESAEGTAELKLGGRFEPPQIRHAFNEETVQPGNSVFMKCIASGNPTPEITWELYGRRLTNNDVYQIGQYVTVNGDVISHLNITSIHTNDGGLYRCVASSKVGSADHSARINVYGLPFVRSMEKQAIVAGGTLIVHCPFAGHPVEAVVWERDGRLLPINRKQKVFPNGTLIIENVERASDQATYVCVAKNSQGYSARGSLEVQVMVPPQIHPFDFGEESINSGDMAIINCAVVKGDLPIKILWTLNGRPVETVDGINMMKTKQRVSQLSIDDVQAHHTGEYKCIARNRAGDVTFSAYLHVNVPPQISHFDFGGEAINSGDIATTQCTVSKGDFPLNISWVFNDKPISLVYGVTVGQMNKRISTLSIDAVEAEHSGEFTCIARNSAGEASYSAILNIKVPPQIHPFDFGDEAINSVSPQITPFDFGEESINSGDSTSLTCSVHKGDLPINISWLHNNISIGYIDGILVSKVGKKVGTITIDSVQEDHAGSYTCIAENKAGVIRYSATLHVNVSPQIALFDFGEDPINSGDFLSLQCSVHKGDLPINISWLHNNVTIGFIEGVTVSKIGKKVSTLTIDSVQENHAVPPQILPFDFGEDSVNSGDMASLTCSVFKGDLPVKINWLHNNKTIGYDSGISVFKNGKKMSSLSVENVGEEHSGTYTCLVKNQAGFASYSAELHVNVPPQILPFDFAEEQINSGDLASFTCSVYKGDLPINISWLHNNISIGYIEGVLVTRAGKKVSTVTIDSVQEHHSGEYTCIAENKAGITRYSAHLYVNVPPHILPFDFGEESVNSGDVASVQCTVFKGDFPLKITWLHNNKAVDFSSGISIFRNGNKISSLTIETVSEEHSGSYTCFVQNKAGHASYSVDLHVNVPPQIIPFDFGEDQINSGDFASLQCSVHKGDLPINISWLHNNISIGYIDGVMVTKAGKKVSTVTIDSVQENHSGEYTCVAENKAGLAKYSVNLHINVSPQIVPFDFGEESVNSGDVASVQCTIFKGDFPLNITWLHNNRTIGNDIGILVSKIGKKVSSLTIESVGADHSGLYTCLARNRAGSFSYSAELNVNVPPVISPFNFGEASINSGDYASIQCSVHKGDLPLNISWIYKSQSIGYIDGILITKVGKKASSLTIDSAQEFHSGNYTCVAQNKAGKAEYSAHLHINVPPQILPFSFGEDSVNSGDVASLQCTVHKGDLPINITWLQNNKPVGYSNGIIMSQASKKVSTLTIDDVQEFHSGNFTCVAQNVAGLSSYSTELHVNVPPQILHFDFGEESVNSGDLASLTCSVHKGDLPMNITWFHDSKNIGYNEGILISKAGKKISTLSIDSVQEEHVGTYTCVVENRAGKSSYSSELHVNVPPQILHFDFGEESVNSGDLTSLICSVHKGDLPMNISWTHNNKISPQILHFDFGDEPINSGDIASLMCTIHKGDLPINISWYHNNNNIGYKEGIMITKAGKKISTLSIDSVQEDHSGIYTCVAENKAGKSSYSTELHVNGIDLNVCFAELTKGDLPIQFSWLHDNKTLETDGNIVILRTNSKISTLSFDSVLPYYVGEYTCIAKNLAGSTRYSTDLYVHVPPQIIPFDFGEDSINSGDVVSLTCSVNKGDLPLKICWEFNGRTLDNIYGVVISMVNKRLSTLSIDFVEAVNAGEYKCIARNSAGQAESATYLYVNVPPQIIPFDFGEETVNSDDMVSVTCTVSKGDFPIDIYWTLNNITMNKIDGASVLRTNKRISQLSIDSVQDFHSGEYICHAKNSAGIAMHSAFLHVNVLPKIQPFSFGEEPVFLGETTTVQCTISMGDMPVKFSWMLNGKPLNKYLRVTVGSFGKKTTVLNIDNVSDEHAGNYTCLATNSAGISSSSSELIVKELLFLPTALPKIHPFTFGDDPSFVGETVSVQCTIASGDLPITFSWMQNGRPITKDVNITPVGKKVSVLNIDNISEKHAGNYTCIATNKAGLTTYSTQLTVKVLPRLQPFIFGDEPSFMGDSATVQCSLISGDMPVKFSWMLNGKPVKEIAGINVGSFGKKTSVLSIDSVYDVHAGNYTCLAANKAGLSSYSTELVVKVIPRVQPFSFGDEPLFLGESTTVQCSLNAGDLPVKFSWMIKGKSVQEIDGYSVAAFGKKTSVLSIESVSDIHAGTYTCLAANKAGMSSYSTELVVKVLPRVQPLSFGDEPLFLGESTTVQCSINSGDLPVAFSWMLNGKPVKEIDGYSVVGVGKKTSVLSIESVSEIHAGNYTCLAANKAGLSSYSTELVVKVIPRLQPFTFGDEPSFIGDSVTVQCNLQSGDMPVKFSWMLNGEPIKKSDGYNVYTFGKKTSVLGIDSIFEIHSGNYTCLAANKAGLSTFTTALTVKATVQCNLAAGDLPVKFSWMLNGKPVEVSDGINASLFVKKTSVLSIDSLAEVHAGNYTCLAANKAGLSSSTTELVVKVLPRITPFYFEDNPVQSGQFVEVSCTVSEGDLPIKFQWELNGKELEDFPEMSVSSVGKRTSFLSIETVSYTHAGNYTCKAKNMAGQTMFSSELQVNVPPQIVPFGFGDGPIHAGQFIQVSCTVSEGDLPIKIDWHLNGQPLGYLPEVSTTAVGKRISILAVESVSYNHAGNYTCIAKNKAGEIHFSTELQVNVPPQIAPFDFGNVPVHSGQFVQVTCTVFEGDMPIKIDWLLNNKALERFPEMSVSAVGKRSSFLSIDSVSYTHAGIYTCKAMNQAGETICSLSFSVAPQITPFDFGNEPVHSGQSVQVQCFVSEGDLPVRLEWLLNEKPLEDFPEVSTVTLGKRSSILSIDSVSYSHAGNYTCTAKNKAGMASLSSELQVNVPPQIVPFDFGEDPINSGDMVTVLCTVNKGDVPIGIKWTFNGKTIDNLQGVLIVRSSVRITQLTIDSVQDFHRGEYICAAKNKAGVAKHSVFLHVNVLPKILPFDFGNEPTYLGESNTVHCSLSVGDIPVKFNWTLNERPLATLQGVNIASFGKKTSVVSIDSVNEFHAGNYTCFAENRAGFSSFSTSLVVKVLPHIVPFSFGDSAVYSGQTTQVTCLVSEGDVPLELTWSFEGNYVDSQNGVSTTKVGKKASLLLIDSVTEGQAGNYTCTAKNRAGSVLYTASLNVYVPPRWILEPTDKAFAQGSDAAVECKADGFPKPVVTWKRATGVSPGDYKDFKPNNPDIKVEDGTLTINNIQKTNEGYYLCEAVNGIGSGLSAVILISVQAPPQFEVKYRNQTSRRGDPAVLQCEAKGEKPIGILWNINNKRLEPKGDNRYTIREEILPNGVLSDLSIKRTERSDSAIFTCVATNAFGSDDTNINMIVQEVPEIPYALKVLDKSGKTVQLSWVSPYDGNSPIKNYVIEYKPSKGSWEKNSERVLIPGDQTEAGIFTLRPATTYHIRIIAENEIGASDPSETVTIITAEEVPSGPPSNIRVEAEDQHSLIVYWKPPHRDQWNGDIQGYYVGIKFANTDKPYLFETVEFQREEEGKEHHLKISNLKTYTQYSIVVQAFNKIGAGPISEEVKANTAEGVPEQPPERATCTTLTAQTIRVSWVSPPLTSANGVIKGYKVIYGPSDSWFDENTKDTKITASSETILHGLKKYTNYSMEVLAYTSGGDGVRTTPIHCQTEQDVPESPTAVKALVMSADSILVSWKPPTEPNGIIEYYMVYYKEAGNSDAKPKSQKIVPNLRNQNLSYQAKNLNSSLKYEFWVTAATTIGEGQTSKKVLVSPSTSVPAKTASFDDSFTTTYKEDVTLPCLAVGVPPPVITWNIKGVKFSPNSNDRIRQQPDGSLFIRDVTRTDAGEYSCRVENDYGQDSTDGEPIHGYTIHYKPEFGDWETVQVAPNVDKYAIEKLLCGTRYQLYVTAYNSIGTGDPSDNLNPKTRGEKPIIPSADKFIEVSSNSIILHLGAWSDGGCPMLYFVIEQKKKTSTEWIQVSNNVKPGQNFVLLDLDPAQWYHLRVTAHNNAGFNVAEYEFATLTVTGGTIAPARDMPAMKMLFPWIPDWVDWNIAVPVAATVVVVVVGIVVICVALSRKAHGPLQTRLRSDCM
ncbi:hypothetical protein NQ314_002796 [Rhamnusium bicolor]|uniref:Uncharacterized protein n=1 Tax=Rhamnusium bicolor TaxID=1586634 RepID=A0AAV8ZQQ5_9CUCU|nr:hypothetical protein NQ314_002796 [Rhamnusium bicolor]